MTKLLEQYQAALIVTIIAIRVLANTAFDYGGHTLTLAPMDGGKADYHPTEILRDLAEELQRRVVDRSLH